LATANTHFALFSPEQQRLQALYALPAELLEMIRSGISPRRGDSERWYDRTIRAGSGIILLVFLIAVVVVGWVVALKGR
jgi:hypothetical protein